MAQRKTKTASKNSSSKKSSSSRKSASWLAKFSRTQLIVISVFVLAFASIGSWMIYNSYAATWYCTAHEYYQYEPGTYHGYCVYQIQTALVEIGYASHTPSMEPGIDGIYGPGTAASVKVFQKWWNAQHYGQPVVTLYPDGVIGSSTWNAICPSLKKYSNYTGGYTTQIYNNLSCWHTPYGSAPV